MMKVMTMSDRNACINEMPAALMAVSSELSPRFPNVMSEARSMANGKACGTSMSPMYQKNCAMTSIVRPLPIKSSMYLHKNCIISTNWQMKNVPKKSRPNCLAINMSNFLILSIFIFVVLCLHPWIGMIGILFLSAKVTQKNKKLFFFRFFILIIGEKRWWMAWKTRKNNFFWKFLRKNLFNSNKCITFAPANQKWLVRMAG